MNKTARQYLMFTDFYNIKCFKLIEENIKNNFFCASIDCRKCMFGNQVYGCIVRKVRNADSSVQYEDIAKFVKSRMRIRYNAIDL